MIRNTNRMATELPRIRTDWGSCQERAVAERWVGEARAQPREGRRQRGGRCGQGLTSECRKELRQVKISRGTCGT